MLAHRDRAPGLVALLATLPACGEQLPESPSDDPVDWVVDTSRSYEPVVGEPHWVVPSAALPEKTPCQRSNNNVAVELFAGRLFLAWRTAPTHFADAETALHVISSPDDGRRWRFEASHRLGTDVREPMLYRAGDSLFLTFFEAGIDPFAFAPKGLWRSRRVDRADWSARKAWGEPAEVVWDVKHRNGRLWRTSYLGNHYSGSAGGLELRFMVSDDGKRWRPVAADGDPVVYRGGASEAAFELAADGSLWAVLRNEDGDATGFGSLLCHAPAAALADWQCPSISDPERYDSPRMFRHGEELYLVARRDLGGPYDQGREGMTLEEERSEYLVDYSLRPKRTALYHIDRAAGRVVHLFDLPSAGDTAFPSIRRTGAHTFLLANYTSPPEDPDRTWLEGQISPDGTAIYLVTLTFVPR
jgi:hypothetical protein